MLRAAAVPRPEAVGPEGPPLALAVIGHVNHGKTALVRALTGIETDRLKEEIERGLSITLGFAWRDNSSGGVDIIDAPGHEDFLRAMVIGTTGARAVLLVVSATEGFGRQTREHLQIAGLLGIRAGVVAITKSDLLSETDQATVVARIRDGLRGSFLQDEPALLCSAVTGQGLDDLHAAIEALATRAPAPRRLAGAFLPIDRAFTIAGTGTVVTGTLQGGALHAEDAAVLQPSGRAVSLRQIQVHSEGRDRVAPGGRVAIALRGVAADEVHAGEVLCAPGAFSPALQVDVEVTVAAGGRALKHRDEVRVLWGARQDMARVRLLGETAIAPGERGLAQLRFAAPVVAFAEQRAILRRPSPAQTLGGMIVLDPEAPLSRGRTAERAALLRAVADGDLATIAEGLARRDRGLVSLAEVSRLARQGLEDVRERLSKSFEDLDAARLVLRSETAATRQAYLDRLAEAHRRAPTRFRVAVGAIRSALSAQAHPDLTAHVERGLAADGAIRLDAGQVALPDHDPLASLPAAAIQRFDSLEAALRAGGLTPPDVATLTAGSEADADLIALLVDSGRALSLRNHALRQTLVFHRDALEAAAAALRTAFPPPLEFTTGEARAALETSRKFIVPVLEYLDTLGATLRTGDVRQVV